MIQNRDKEREYIYNKANREVKMVRVTKTILLTGEANKVLESLRDADRKFNLSRYISEGLIKDYAIYLW